MFDRRIIDEGGRLKAYEWKYVAGSEAKTPELQRINAENYGELDHGSGHVRCH